MEHPFLIPGRLAEVEHLVVRDQRPNGTSELGGLKWLLREGVLTHKAWIPSDGRSNVNNWYRQLFKDGRLLTVDKHSHGSRDVLPSAVRHRVG